MSEKQEQKTENRKQKSSPASCHFCFQLSAFRFALFISAFCFQLSAFAQSNLTASLTFTNAAGITNGDAITIAATTWTVTNSSASLRYIARTNSAAAGATNFFNKLVSLTNNGGYTVSWVNKTNFTIRPRTFDPATFSASKSGTWGILTLTTNPNAGANLGANNIVVNKITWADGSTQTTAATGGSAGLTNAPNLGAGVLNTNNGSIGTNVDLSSVVSLSGVNTNYIEGYSSSSAEYDALWGWNTSSNQYVPVTASYAGYGGVVYSNGFWTFNNRGFGATQVTNTTLTGFYKSITGHFVSVRYGIAQTSLAAADYVTANGSNAMVAAWTSADTLLNTNVGLVINTNFGTQLASNLLTFFNPSGNAGNIYVRSNYIYQGSSGGYPYWQRSNDVLGSVVNVWSNGAFQWLGTNWWSYRTNDGATPPFTTTNGIYFFINSGLDGYPTNAQWSRLNAGPGAPTGIPFTSTVNTNVNPFAQITSPLQVFGPLNASNTMTANVEKYGSDSKGRPGFYPYMTVAGVASVPTNKPQTIFIGAGTFTNLYQNLSEPQLSGGQNLIGSGVGVTILGGFVDPVTNAALNPLAFSITGTNTIAQMTIRGLVSPTNAVALGISKGLYMRDMEIGDTNAIDSVYASPSSGGIQDAVFERVKFISQWDTTRGVMSAEYRDCYFRIYGANQNTNNLLFKIYGAHGMYCESNAVIRGGEIFVETPTQPGPWDTGPEGTNFCVGVSKSAGSLRIYGTRLIYPSDCLAILNPNNCTNILGYFYQNGTYVGVTNGVYTTNANLFNATFTGRTFINTAVFPTSSSTNLWSVTNASASLNFYYNGSSWAALNNAGNWNVSSLTINGSTLSDSSRNLTTRSLTTSITNTLAFTTVGFFTNTLGVNATAYFSAGSTVVVSNEFNNVVVSITTPTVIQLHPNWKVSGTTMSATLVAQ